MKKTAYVIFFFVLSVSFVMVYYAGYYYATQRMDKGNLVKISETDGNDNPALNDDAKSVDLGNDEVLSKDTEYILESYDVNTEENDKKTLEMPIGLIGLNREEVIDYISENAQSFADDNEEIVSVQLISFSSGSIVLRKNYNLIEEDTESYKYWLKDVEGYVVVYKSDKETVYFNTDILTSELPEEEKTQIEEGKYVKDIHELYNYLESYTS